MLLTFLAPRYSLHSWIGITTSVLFGLQYAGGFYHFLFPRSSDTTRAAFVPPHAAMGLFLFLMVIITAASGIMEKNTFTQVCTGGKPLIGNHTEAEKVAAKEAALQECRLANTFGLVLVLLAGAVFWTVVPKKNATAASGPTTEGSSLLPNTRK
jgi:hypothetical protein